MLLKNCCSFALLSCCLFNSPLAAVVECISFPVDSRHWTLLDPVLPHGQNEIWLVPEGSKAEEREYIIVTELNGKTPIKNAIAGAGQSKEDRIYLQNATETKMILAHVDRSNHLFAADCAFKGGVRVHDVLYIAPEELVKEQDRKAWGERLSLAAVATTKDDPSWITVTSGGIFQHNKKLNVEVSMRKFTHPDLGFSISFPSTWAYETVETPFKKVGEMQSVKRLSFHRMDELATGSVNIVQTDKKMTAASLTETLKTAFKKETIVAQGNIENNEGVQGRYLVLKVADDNFEIVAFYPSQSNLLFMTEMRIYEKNFYPLFDTILETFKSFSLPKANGPTTDVQ